MLVYWNLSDFQHVRYVKVTFRSDQWERTMFITLKRKIKDKTGRRQRPSVRLTLLGTGRREVSERSVDTKLNSVTNTPTVMPIHLLSEAADSTKQLVIQKSNTTTLHLSMDSTTGNGHPRSYANFTPKYQAIHKQCWSILYTPRCSPCGLEKWNQYKRWLVTWCRFVNTYITAYKARSMTPPHQQTPATDHSTRKRNGWAWPASDWPPYGAWRHLLLLKPTAWWRSWLDAASWTLEQHVSQARLLELGLASVR